jgi:hypothetical protein
MSDNQHPVVTDGFDENFDKELIQMWQSDTYPQPGDLSALTRRLSDSVRQFDRRIFWRNVMEYGAGVIVVIWSAFQIASGERMLFAPLTSMGAALFILTYIWKQHRAIRPMDPLSSANDYRVALLDRLDRQIRLIRGVRYWYVLPCWIFFVTVLVSGILRGRPFFPLLIEFLSATLLAVIVIWLNERYGLRKLLQERRRVEAIQMESSEGFEGSH